MSKVDVKEFFSKVPQAQPLYEAFEREVLQFFGDEPGSEGVTIKVQKSQISFSNKYGFAFVSLPVRRKKGWPEICILVTFGLGHQVIHPRIAVSVEPYPNRWTHHVIVAKAEEIDAQLMNWVQDAYFFALTK